MRLIDADDFIARLDHVPMVQDAIKKAMDHMPTIEPERKKGKWIETDSYEPCWFKCDQCGRLHDFLDAYCPNCGSEMRRHDEGTADDI